jgi:predicted metal-dependent phosphoesterase TrpH
MITSRGERVTRNLESAGRSTDILKKSRQMTAQQAHRIGRLGKADLHMHSTYSDGIATIEQLLEHVQHQTNLDVIALTDHDVIEGSLHARDLWAKGSYRFDFIVGEEISTKEGHLLGLFLEKRIRSGLSMEQSIDLIHEQGGIAVVAHPLHPLFRHSCSREVLERIHAHKDLWLDGVETWNASFCGIYANRLAMRTNREFFRWPELGNSDAHTLNAIGRGFTWFEGKNALDVRAAVTSGLSAPGGRLWDVQDYVVWVRHRMSKEGRQAAQRFKAA